MEQAGSLGHQADRVLSAGDAGQRSGSDRVQHRARWARPRSSRPGVVRLGHPRRGGTLTLVRIRVSGTAERASRRPLRLPTPDTLHLATRGDEEHMSPGANVVKKRERRASSRSYWSCAQRYSIATFWPSTKPDSPRPCLNAAMRGAKLRNGRRNTATKNQTRRRRLSSITRAPCRKV